MAHTEETRSVPGARAPDRTRRLHGSGLDLALNEWGDPGDPLLALVHGGFDFSRTFDVFAPLLADAGWRVVAWDARGHGDSEHAHLYSWAADVRDHYAVLAELTDAPICVVGHSKGGGQMLDLLDARPGLARAFVNLDGLPSQHSAPDISDRERRRMRRADLEASLDRRVRRNELRRRPDTIEGLAGRRAPMNPRLSRAWLEYLVTVGARRDDDGWRWKIDPVLHLGGFGPWRPQWSMDHLAALPMPFLGVLSGVADDPMGWNSRRADVEPYLPPGGRLEFCDDIGHFLHIEQPRAMADLVLEFLEPHR
ncbi:MAG: alpha/beta hydrolase [Acidimicrobiales bacterium]|nr:alpha/beta hydrolase [Acidimicrobiales bacterium]